MTFADLFGVRAHRAPRTSCPFCPGPEAVHTGAPLCNVCRRHLGQGAHP